MKMKTKLNLRFIPVSIIIAVLYSSAFLFLTSMSVSADGGENRKASPDEKKFLETVNSELRAALPEAPAGWSRNADEKSQYDEVGVGFEKQPVMMSVVATYSKNESQAEGEAKSKAASEIGEKNKPALDAIMKKQEEISAKITKAAEKMDFKEVENLQKESEVVAKELEKIGAAMTAEMRSSSGGDILKSTNATISAEINPAEIYISEPSELPEIEGCKVLQEKPENPKNDDPLKTVILIGPWTVSKNAEGGVEIKSPYNNTAPYDKIMCAAVHVEATKDVTAEFLKSAGVKKLSAIISK